VGDGTDSDGWQHATALRRIGFPRDGGRGVQRPTDKVRWREWRLVGVAEGASRSDGGRESLDGGEGAGEDEAKEMVFAFLRLMTSALWRSSKYAHLPPDLLAPARLHAKHAKCYEATFRGVLVSPHVTPSAAAGEAAGWRHADAESLAELLEAALRAMVLARAAFGYPAGAGHLGSVRAMVTGAMTSRGYRHVDAGAHVAAVVALTGLHPSDVRLSRWLPTALLPAFYVANDRSRNWIVISIRGTHSPQDLLTDLHAAAAPFALAIGGTRLRGTVHAGMLAAARILLRAVTPVVAAMKKELPSARVVVVGHSLGAGTAVLLAALLRDPAADPGRSGSGAGSKTDAAGGVEPPARGATEPLLCPDALCFALSPPAMADLATARALGGFTTSVIVGTDAVARLCAANALQLASELEGESTYAAIAQSRAWQVAEVGVLGALRAVRNLCDSVGGLSSPPQQPNEDAAASPGTPVSAAAPSAEASAPDLEKDVLFQLRRGGEHHHYAPGRIIHLCDRATEVEAQPISSTRAPLANDAAALGPAPAPLLIALVEPAHYSKLLLLPELVSDHVPDRVLEMLSRAHLAACEGVMITGGDGDAGCVTQNSRS